MSAAVRVGFAVDTRGVVVALDVSVAVSHAYDVLVAAGLSPGRASVLAVTCEQHGRDPVAFARRLARLRQVVR